MGLGCAAQFSSCCLEGFLARLRSRSLCGVLLFLGTLSARDVGSSSTPHGFTYYKSSREQRVGSPAGQCLGCWSSLLFVSVLVSRSLGLRFSFRTGSSQQSPALWLLLAPSATARCFPISEVRRVYVVDSFIVYCRTITLTRHHSLPSVWSHLQWQAKLSLP